MINQLLKLIILIDFVLKTMYNTDKTELENKIPNVTGFVKEENSLNQKTKFMIVVIQQQKLY